MGGGGGGTGPWIRHCACSQQRDTTPSTSGLYLEIYILTENLNAPLCFPQSNPVGALPTYGELIDMFDEFGSDQHLLCMELSKRFPSISTKRPGRLVDTITRIVAPTKPSLNGVLRLTGSPLRSYRQRIWEPRVRTAKSRGRLHVYFKLLYTIIIDRITCIDSGDSYPDDLIPYGLTKDLLNSAMSEIEAGNTSVWSLSGKIPTIGFYRALHLYLKQHLRLLLNLPPLANSTVVSM